MKRNYDIFISYRRRDSGDKAEHLKDLLEPKYKRRVSFDRENLTGLFDVSLAWRIDKCKDFLLIVGKNSLVFDAESFSQEQVDLYGYLGRCSHEEFERKIIELGSDAHLDFVRIEIARALNRKVINIIPIVPESTIGFDFSKLSLPQDIAGIKRYEAVFYSDSPNALFKDIMPKLCTRLISKPDMIMKKMAIVLLVVLAVITAVISGGHYIAWKSERAKQELMVDTALCGKYLAWSDSISIDQVKAVREILDHMVRVEGGTFMMGAAVNADGTYDDDVCIELETPQQKHSVTTFWICKYEVNVSEWARIMGGKYKKNEEKLPVTNITYAECEAFVKKLADLTNLDFQIPTEVEWEYAARGGIKTSGTKYSGSNNADSVAWYAGNSAGRPHACDATNSPMYCNELDVYDMSGNVSEWCSADFIPYNPEVPIPDRSAKVIRGGSYESESYELTVYHRDPMNAADRSETVGLRIIIKD